MIFYIPKERIKKIGILFVFVAAFCIGFFGYSPQVIESSSHEWGLSFRNEGEAPIPNLDSDTLTPLNAFYKTTQPTKKLFITFDAGFENGNTPAILEALKKHNVQAVFFLVGPYIESNQELVKQRVAEGHIRGNHSYNQPDMRSKSKEEFLLELSKMEQSYQSIIGQHMTEKYYRPPEGKFTTENLEWAKEAGYKTLFWSLAYVDWYVDKQPSHEQAFSKLIPRTHDGAIVLLHSTSKTNAEILDQLLTKWEELGYTFGKPSEIN